MKTEALFSLFDEEVSRTIAAAKAQATTYEEALGWLETYVHVRDIPSNAELESPRAMFAREYVRHIYSEAYSQLKKEARGLPIANS